MTKNNNFHHRWKALVGFVSYDHGIKTGEFVMLHYIIYLGECQISIFCKILTFVFLKL
jgi:hypothetical protein